jgi:hypothetical protein
MCKFWLLLICHIYLYCLSLSRVQFFLSSWFSCFCLCSVPCLLILLQKYILRILLHFNRALNNTYHTQSSLRFVEGEANFFMRFCSYKPGAFTQLKSEARILLKYYLWIQFRPHGNILAFHSNDQFVDDVKGINRCLFWEKCETHNTLCAQIGEICFIVKAGNADNNHQAWKSFNKYGIKQNVVVKYVVMFTN